MKGKMKENCDPPPMSNEEGISVSGADVESFAVNATFTQSPAPFETSGSHEVSTYNHCAANDLSNSSSQLSVATRPFSVNVVDKDGTQMPSRNEHHQYSQSTFDSSQQASIVDLSAVAYFPRNSNSLAPYCEAFLL